jgi:peptidoglycan/LPS O-acetylase OafA/YrhL
LGGRLAQSQAELLSNISLTMNLTGSKAAIFPLWSLPYEIDMYIFLPVLFLFAVRFRSAWTTFGLILAFAVLAFIQLRWSPRLDLVQYVGCFLPGIIAYQLSSRPRFHWPAALWPILLVFLALLFAGGSALHLKPFFLLRWAVCLALGLATSQFRPIPDGLLRWGAAIVAKYSYGIYLLHVFAMHLSFVAMAAYPVPLRAIAFVAAMFAFPFAAYHLIEKPGIDLGKRLVADLPRAHFARTSSQGEAAN